MGVGISPFRLWFQSGLLEERCYFWGGRGPVGVGCWIAGEGRKTVDFVVDRCMVCARIERGKEGRMSRREQKGPVRSLARSATNFLASSLNA